MWDNDFKFGRTLTSFAGIRPGKDELRKAEEEAGGMNTIRRVDWKGADGTAYILNTRGGMPRVLATPKKKTSVQPSFHGLCRRLGVYLGLTSEVVFQPANYVQPTDGNTRYFKAPGVSEPPVGRTEDAADYSQTIGDYALLVSGTKYVPTSDTTQLTPLQWLYEGEGGTVRVLGILMKSDSPLSTTWYVLDYGPFRKTTPSTPYDWLTVIDEVTITSTENFIASMPAKFPYGWTIATGSAEYQTIHTSLDENVLHDLDTSMPPDYIGIPEHVRTANRFQVEASPNGHQIVLMRGFSGALDNYEYWNNDKYTTVGATTCFFTIATIDIVSTDGVLSITAPDYKFQWVYKPPPSDFTASCIVRTRSEPKVSLGVVTTVPAFWQTTYFIDSLYSSGTPYTIRNCCNFCYDKNGTLLLSYVESDYGPVQVQHNHIGNVHYIVKYSYIDTEGPPPPYDYDFDQALSTTVYEINGGYGWGLLGTRFYAGGSVTPTITTDIISYFRLTNNVMLVNTVHDGPNFDTYFAYENYIFTPSGQTVFTDLFPTSPIQSHFTTYNVETGVLAGSNDGTGPICWV